MTSENNNYDFFVSLEWNEASEQLLVSWADIAICYTWIFDQAYRKLTKMNYTFSIPIIVLSTITGTLSMSLNTLLPSDYITTGQVVLGGVNIFTGIITTLQNFFRYAQQSELNLTATNDWAKLHRNIKIELSIERHNRRPATEFVRSTRQEYERLLNSRPTIPHDIIKKFKAEFANSDIIKPEILDKVEHTIIYDDSNRVDQYKSNLTRPIEEKPKFLDKIKSIVKTNPSPSESPLKYRTTPSPDYREIRRNRQSVELKDIKEISEMSNIENLDTERSNILKKTMEKILEDNEPISLSVSPKSIIENIDIGENETKENLIRRVSVNMDNDYDDIKISINK